MPRLRPRLCHTLTLAALLLPLAGPAAPAQAQPANLRTPNVEGTWVTPGGAMFFSFLHRFTVGSAPSYTVGNIPMLHLSGGYADWLSVGALYATETVTVPGASQELELWAKQRFLDQETGAPFSLSLKEAYNLTALSPDAELSASRTWGLVGLHAAARGMGNYRYTGSPRVTGAIGASYQLTPHLNLAADLAASPMRQATEPMLAWGVGAQIAIPYTPHTMSLQVTNTGTDSVQGASVPTDDLRFGFDFTVPLSSAQQWLEIIRPAAPREETSGEAPEPDSAASRFDAKAFYAANCAGCHGANGQGGFASDLTAVETKDDAFIEMRIAKGSPKGMPGYRSKLSAAEMTALVDYVKSL